MPIQSPEEFTENFANYLNKNMHDSFPVDEGWYKLLAKLISERDKMIVNELKPYIKHFSKCIKSFDPDTPSYECTCGLDNILEERKEYD